jgi:hypothetical protein
MQEEHRPPDVNGKLFFLATGEGLAACSASLVQ